MSSLSFSILCQLMFIFHVKILKYYAWNCHDIPTTTIQQNKKQKTPTPSDTFPPVSLYFLILP